LKVTERATIVENRVALSVHHIQVLVVKRVVISLSPRELLV
jgi:hypothetical protein